MKYLVLLALFALAAARPQNAPEITNLRSEFENPGDGTYNFVFENSDGTIVEQKGYIKNPEESDPEKRIQVMEGSFAYTVDGAPIKVTYVADENGFAPSGDHLPTPPPTPDHVLKTLQILNANAAAQRKRQALYSA